MEIDLEKKVAFGIRLRSDIGYNEFWQTWAGMEKPNSYILLPQKGYAADDAARQIFRNFLTTEASHLLLLDDDATLHPQTLNRLMSRNLPVVSALVFTKSLPPAPTIWRGASGVVDKFITWRTRVDDVVSFFESDGVGEQIRRAFAENNGASALVLNDHPAALSRTDNVGFHCTLIQRKVIEAIGEPFCVGVESGVHEDFDFSSRAICAGFDLFVDKTVISGHITPRGIGAMDFWAWMIALKLDAQQFAQMESEADKNAGSQS